MILLILATRNEHKVGEIQQILGPGLQFLTLHDLPPTPPLVEDQATFEGNAAAKALQVVRFLPAFPKVVRPEKYERCYVLADDSGLEVDALQGRPGVHSARFAHLESSRAGNASDADNNAKLLHLLADIPAPLRTARFRCVLALAPLVENFPQNISPVCAAEEAEVQLEIFQGKCEGHIDLEGQGKGGFGYDPLFIPEGSDRSFGQLSADEKNLISHRAKALRQLREWLAVS